MLNYVYIAVFIEYSKKYRAYHQAIKLEIPEDSSILQFSNLAQKNIKTAIMHLRYKKKCQ